MTVQKQKNKPSPDLWRRFLDGKSVMFPGVSVALLALAAGRSYRLPAFQRHAANYILANLGPGNALTILQAVFNSSSSTTKASAPSTRGVGVREEREERDNALNSEQEVVGRVVARCLEVVDGSAEAVLSSREWEEVPREVVAAILSRDSLAPPSEAAVVRAIDRWAARQCLLASRPPSPAARREVAGELRLLVRLLTLPPATLRRLQATTAFLHQGELEAIVRTHTQPR